MWPLVAAYMTRPLATPKDADSHVPIARLLQSLGLSGCRGEGIYVRGSTNWFVA